VKPTYKCVNVIEPWPMAPESSRSEMSSKPDFWSAPT